MDAEKILLGNSIPLYEVEEDFDLDLAEKASIEYDMVNVINSVGVSDFESVYAASMPHIVEQDIDIQRRFCYELLAKIEEVYHYTFPVSLDFPDENSISDLYEFVKFLGINYIDFLVKVWKLLLVDLKAIDISSYCEANQDLIISKVDQVVNSGVFSKLVSLWLRTNLKEDLIEFIVEKSIKSRMIIFLKIQEGEENG